jgi:hypothetical protein
MPSSTSSSERRRVPLALCLGLAAFFALERGLWANRRWLEFATAYAPPGTSDSLVAERARLVRGPLPVVLVGSSQVREGLDCEVISPRLGRPCVNLGIGGGSPLDVAYLIGRLDAAAPRRTLVLGLFPKVMHMAPKSVFVDSATLSCLLESGAWRGMRGRDWGEVGFGLLQGLSGTLRHKRGLEALVETRWGRLAAAWRRELPPPPLRLLTDADRQPGDYFAVRDGRVDLDQGVPGPFTRAQERALDRILDEEVARGNRAVLIDFPTRPRYRSTLLPETDAHYRELMRSLQARSDILFLGRDDVASIGIDDFLDFTHLSEAGRRRMSEGLAAILAEKARPE